MYTSSINRVLKFYFCNVCCKFEVVISEYDLSKQKSFGTLNSKNGSFQTIQELPGN